MKSDSYPEGEKFAFFVGLLTAGCIGLLLFAFAVYRIGWERVRQAFPSMAPGYSKVLDMPESLLGEARSLGMVIENAQNPIGVADHSSWMVRSDSILGYTLNPSAVAIANMLRPKNRFNFDPPVLYRKPGTDVSFGMRSYLRGNTLISFTYSTDEQARRLTLPIVRSSSKVLVVGDSVPFGVGVDDSLTVASYLQRLLGREVQVVNASVSGYDGRQVVEVVKRELDSQDYLAVVYVACQNDFMKESDDWGSVAKEILGELADVRDRFETDVIVLLQSYMEYNYEFLFQSQRWRSTESLRTAVREACAENGFRCLDWSDLFQRRLREARSVFAGFALYVDHCHFSPAGNKLAAEALFNELPTLSSG